MQYLIYWYTMQYNIALRCNAMPYPVFYHPPFPAEGERPKRSDNSLASIGRPAIRYPFGFGLGIYNISMSQLVTWEKTSPILYCFERQTLFSPSPSLAISAAY